MCVCGHSRTHAPRTYASQESSHVCAHTTWTHAPVSWMQAATPPPVAPPAHVRTGWLTQHAPACVHVSMCERVRACMSCCCCCCCESIRYCAWCRVCMVTVVVVAAAKNNTRNTGPCRKVVSNTNELLSCKGRNRKRRNKTMDSLKHLIIVLWRLAISVLFCRFDDVVLACCQTFWMAGLPF